MLCLQETKLQTAEGFEDMIPNYHSYWTCSQTKKGYSGVAIFVKKTIQSKLSSPLVEKPKKPKQMTLGKAWGIKEKEIETPKVSVETNTPFSTDANEINEFLSVESVDYEFNDTKFSGEGRTITINLGKFYIVGCYVVNSGQNLERLTYRCEEWDPYLRNHLITLNKSKPVIFLGDLNVGHLDIDIYNYNAKHISKQSGLTPLERNSMSTLLTSGFTDSLRYFYPGTFI